MINPSNRTGKLFVIAACIIVAALTIYIGLATSHWVCCGAEPNNPRVLWDVPTIKAADTVSPSRIIHGSRRRPVAVEDQPLAPAFPLIASIVMLDNTIMIQIGDDPSAADYIHLSLFEDESIGVTTVIAYDVNDPILLHFEDWVEYILNRDLDELCYPDAEPRWSYSDAGFGKMFTAAILLEKATAWRADYGMDGVTEFGCAYTPLIIR